MLGIFAVDPLKWGWEEKNNVYHPIMTDLPPAHSDILKVIKCSCNGNCETLKCTCRKNGIDCSVYCKNCKGISCKNSITVEYESDNETIQE